MNLSPPIPAGRMWRLVMRNYLVWKKLLASSVAVHLADPVIFMLGFGFGLGALIGDVEGLSYLQFVAAGMVAYGTMNSASFEALYSAFTRMHVQRTWESILNAPMNLDDILLGEWLWAAIKGLMAGVAMLVVLTVLGLASWPLSFLAIPCIFVAALAFSGIALAVNAAARGYDFFSYYFSLFITPMMMLSGAFFPVYVLPEPLRVVSSFLPLSHVVSLLRPLLTGHVPPSLILHLAVLSAYAIIGVYISALITRRRLLN